jgi:hypothetical protein
MGHSYARDNYRLKARRRKRQERRSSRFEAGLCIRCGQAATFDYPRSYCTLHWARWWTGNRRIPDQERRKTYLEGVLEVIAKKHDEIEFMRALWDLRVGNAGPMERQYT